MDIKLIIFDVDGVIVDSEELHFKAYQGILQKLGLDLDPKGYKQHFAGKSIQGGYASFAQNNKITISPDEFVKLKINATYDIFQQHLKFFDDTLEFIKLIKGKNIDLSIGKLTTQTELAISTGLAQPFMDILLAKPQFQDTFKIIVTPDNYTKSKPDPECYQKVLDLANIPAENAIGIEDAPAGIAALNATGIYSVGVLNTHTKEELKDANQVVKSLVDLVCR